VTRRASAVPPDDARLGFVHDTKLGRCCISGLVSVLVLAVLAWNLPDGKVGDEAADWVQPFAAPIGLTQNWSLFAPDPSTRSLEVTARITFDDGTTEDFSFPDGDPFIGVLREYRWRKFEGELRSGYNESMQRPAAEWIAREASTDRRKVTKVVLVQTVSETPTPGTDEKRKWRTFDFYTLEVD
jgi:hypothetical protein